MDGVFGQRRPENAWDLMNMVGADDDLSSSSYSVNSDDGNDMSFDGFSGGFRRLFEEQY